MDRRTRIAKELFSIARALVGAPPGMQQKLDKFRRAKNKKPVAVLSYAVSDPMGNAYTYKIVFKYEETMRGDRFYAVERLVSGKTLFSLANMQNKPSSLHTTEDVTYLDGHPEGEETIMLWHKGNARKFVTKLLDDMLALSPRDVAKWLNSGVMRPTSPADFELVK